MGSKSLVLDAKCVMLVACQVKLIRGQWDIVQSSWRRQELEMEVWESLA